MSMWKDYNPNEKIEGVDDEMQLLMHSFFNSIKKVTDDYLYWSIKDNEAESIPYVERAFAYELYFQWNMNEDVDGKPLFKSRDKYKINAEIRKDFIEKIPLANDYSYPDMVLHGGNESPNNYIVCEIKRKSTIRCNKDAMTKDLNKLVFFLRNDLNSKYNVDWEGYRLGVFLLIDKDGGIKNDELKPSDIVDNINTSKLDIESNHYSKIICVLYNGKTIQYENLGEIIKSKK